MDDIADWLEVDAFDYGHGVQSNEETVTDIEMAREAETPEPDSDENEVEVVHRQHLSEVRRHLDAVIHILGTTDIM